MPSPIAHSIVGLSIASNSEKGVIKVFKNSFLNYLLIIFVSLVPDFDIIPGFFVGLPAKYHHGITHSFISGIVFALLFSSLIYLFKRVYFTSRTLLFIVLYFFHIILDLFTIDTGEINGLGMPIFFPFSFSLYKSSVVLFSSSLFEDGYLTFQAIFRYSNLFPIIMEIIISSIIGVLIILTGNILKKKMYKYEG
ncbi:MAG: metal-dependent hydrolase [Candidatus Helarchaeota archaeon]|nr:metal-dependent hydrolase [Candidatus Helarchaeota archaeon]